MAILSQKLLLLRFRISHFGFSLRPAFAEVTWMNKNFAVPLPPDPNTMVFVPHSYQLEVEGTACFTCRDHLFVEI